MAKELKQGLLFTLVTMVLFGGGYNIVVWGIGRAVFPEQAEGSLIRRADGTVVGSRLIAQKFTRPEYFQSQAVRRGLQRRIDGWHELRALESGSPEGRPGAARWHHGGGQGRAGPGALGDGDGKRRGMDPHIPPAAADLQAERVAAARGVPVDRVRDLVRAHTEPPTFGFLGRARVNVLELNLALDESLGSRK